MHRVILNFGKQYIIQCIVAAANNLRLSSEKIEIVAILKEKIAASEDLSEEIKNFKKITELSKFGIKLGELQNFIESEKIDFLKLSDKFKEHSYGLVRELSNSLDLLTPQSIRSLLQQHDPGSIKVDLTKRPTKTNSELLELSAFKRELPRRSKADELKEEIIFEELNKEVEFNFENFEEKVLRHVKELDSFLNRIIKFDYTEGEMNFYIQLMKENGELSQKVGFYVLSNMHTIFSKGLEMVHQKKIAPSTSVVESLRACLIVIVAVVRGKEVDITSYLNRAENFNKTILSKQKGS